MEPSLDDKKVSSFSLKKSTMRTETLIFLFIFLFGSFSTSYKGKREFVFRWLEASAEVDAGKVHKEKY